MHKSYYSCLLVVAAAVAATAPSVFARSAAIYGGTTDTATYSSPSSPVNASALNALGAANASIAANFSSQAFRITTTGVQVLDSLGGFNRAWAANASGDIVGQAGLYNGATYVGGRAVRWNAGSTAVTLLNGLPTTNAADASYAYGINDNGLVVGYSSVSDELSSTGSRPAYWAPGSTTAVELGNLGLFGGYTTSGQASVVNNAGVIAGWVTKYDSSGASQGQRVVRWSPTSVVGGTPTSYNAAEELGTVTGFTSLAASPYSISAINNAGVVIGNYSSTLGTRAVVWDASGNATVLNPINVASISIFIPPRTSYAVGYGSSTASSINDAGVVVGSSMEFIAAGTAITGTQAVMWQPGSTTPTILAGLGTNSSGSAQNVANAINSTGQIVGTVTKYNSSNVSLGTRAVVWYSVADVLDLNTLLSAEDAKYWTLTAAYDISDSLWVTGLGTFDPDGATGPLAGYSRSFLMQVPATYAVPEPSSLAAIGLTGVCLICRRRNA